MLEQLGADAGGEIGTPRGERGRLGLDALGVVDELGDALPLAAVPLFQIRLPALLLALGLASDGCGTRDGALPGLAGGAEYSSELAGLVLGRARSTRRLVRGFCPFLAGPLLRGRGLTITRVIPSVDPRSRAAVAIVELPNADGSIAPGLFAEARPAGAKAAPPAPSPAATGAEVAP